MSAKETSNIIHVYSHGSGQSLPIQMGELRVSKVRGKEIFSFEYDQEFLDSEWSFEIDPQLRLYQGVQYAPDNQNIFGIFLDSAPDRWGRLLMDRRESIRAQSEERPPKTLMESDYLMGVNDESRMGALRFKQDPDGPFLNNDKSYSTPPMTSLRDLEFASFAFESESNLESETYMKQLALLVAPGSSLGGARPKASVQDQFGSLWIAKFPSVTDEVDQGAWELLVYNLAGLCGIDMAESAIEKYYSANHTFLTKRFDRNNSGERIHFFSAMTLLGYQDGADASTGASYLDLVEVILSKGVNVESDLEQLWRRMVFNICVSNTDDHMRNHGFIITRKGLRLSPAFDINPNPRGYGLSLNIDEQSNALDLDIALDVARYFRLSDQRASDIVEDILNVVSGWETEAEQLQISRKERMMMRTSFWKM